MRAVVVALLWAAKIVAAVFAIGALGLASPQVADLGHDIAGARYDAYLAWLTKVLEGPMNSLAPVFRAAEGSPRWLWLRAIIPLNVALLVWAVPNPQPSDQK